MIRSILIVLVCAAGAQSAPVAVEPPELAELNRLYEEARRAALDPIEAKYLERLKGILTKLTEENRTAEAAVVEKAILAFETQLASLKPNRAEPVEPIDAPAGSVVLNGNTAVLEGSLKWADGTIGNWVRSTCRASWHTRDVPAGKYDVFFVYDAAADMGGVVELADFSFSIDARIEPTSEEVSLEEEKRTGGVKKGTSTRPPTLVAREDRVLVFRRVRVGGIETRGGIGLKVSAKHVTEGGIMNLKEIQLVPLP